MHWRTLLVPASLTFALAFPAMVGGCNSVEINSELHQRPSLSLGALPFPGPGRLLSEQVTLLTPGADSISQSGNTAIDNDSLQLSSGTEAISWGIWRLGPGDDSLLSVAVGMTISAGNEAYVGIADFNSGAWEIHGPFTESIELPLANSAHKSPGENCYFSVIASEGSEVLVDQVSISVERLGWQVVEVDTGGFASQEPSLAIVNGNPAISYMSGDVDGPRYLYYAYSATPLGSNYWDWDIVRVDGTSNSGTHSSLAVVEGNPAISYGRNSRLMYTRALTSSGSSPGDWVDFINIDPDMYGGSHTSLSVIDGHPAISYYEGTDGTLKYVWCTNSRGLDPEDWDSPLAIDDEGNTGFFTSLTTVNNRPAIAYFNNTAREVIFTYATSSNGADFLDWWRRQYTLDVLTANENIPNNSLAVIAGNPAICYYDYANGNLRYLRSTTASGGHTSHWPESPVVIDTEGDWGMGCSLAEVMGVPAISFVTGSGLLMYAESITDTGGNPGDWEVETADTGQNASTSLAEVDGKPAIAYYDAQNGNLMYAILFR